MDIPPYTLRQPGARSGEGILGNAVFTTDCGNALLPLSGLFENLDNLLGRMLTCLHEILHVEGS